jgi:hypothetical protein
MMEIDVLARGSIFGDEEEALDSFDAWTTTAGIP